MKGLKDSNKVVWSANEHTTSRRGKLQGITSDRRLGRKLREKTVRCCEDGLRKERNKELTSTRVPIDLTPLPKTHKLAIDLRSPINANSPPNRPSHLQTATHSTKMSTEHSWSTSAASSTGRTGTSSAEPSSHAGTSTSAGPSANAMPNHVHHQRLLITFLALTIVKEKKQIPLPGTMGTTVCGALDVSKFIEADESLPSCPGLNAATEDAIGTYTYYLSATNREMIKIINKYQRTDWEQLKRNRRTPSTMPMAKSIYTRDHTWSAYARASWNMGRWECLPESLYPRLRQKFAAL